MSVRVRVWCFRHGESQNVTDNVAGAVPSAPLTERGHEQAALAARTLAGERIGAVYSSSALRARQTAKPLATAARVDVRALPDLVEVGIGRHEGSSDPDVRRQTADVLRSWVVDNDLTQQVADGETGFAVTARMGKVFQAIAEQHQGETVAVIGHVASLTVALGRLCTLGAAVWGTPLPHAQPFLIEWDGSTWRCPSWPEAK
ncbi:histidine phosphatase family protein [Streptomyces sp. VRA16 Mangrove soil]|uniref:histidine phosphatase family protein n=1 Tax=Streptomyces sp. VRA16 Mangrove soil TaxID=2817434 RepID=UPI001A9FDA0A|nr:histidine phosphatase family protein [Streptomyces sp. VRA16 Mangrove soil]MBO1332593.1 histidine phosphatase family protein [Streptomyces sp. VRA16 Mangrove soil]